MKKTLLTLAVVVASYTTYAQTNTFPSGGNVGIGTTSPDVALNLYGTGDVGLAIGSSINAPYIGFRKGGINKWELVLERNTPDYGMSANDIGFLKNGASTPSLMIQQSTGNVGIGTTAPGYKLQVGTAGASLNAGFNIVGNTGVAAVNGNKAIYLWNDGTTLRLDAYDYSASALDFQVGGNGGNVLLVPNSGNVSIGTTDPKGYKLAVNGNAIATSMTVKLYANWPDYVFKKDYKLPSLLEVKTYIDQNQHLPEMPSEQEIAKDGINLGEIVKLQTKKIEELTLYAIDQQKQIELLKQQQKDSKAQQEQINQLKEQLATITKTLTKN